jgi:hypothetical protein
MDEGPLPAEAAADRMRDGSPDLPFIDATDAERFRDRRLSTRSSRGTTWAHHTDALLREEAPENLILAPVMTKASLKKSAVDRHEMETRRERPRRDGGIFQRHFAWPVIARKTLINFAETYAAMRVVIVMPSAHLHGGAEEALIHLLRYREAAGPSSVLVVLLEEGELQKVFESTGTPVEVVDSGRLRQPWKIATAILKIRDLIKNAGRIGAWMDDQGSYLRGAAARMVGVPAIYFQMGLPDNGSVDRLSRAVPRRAR